MAMAVAHSESSETPLGPRLPLRLGRFVLCEELGSGGMATVYLARMDLAAGIRKLVALKTIHRHLAKERAFVEMFFDEARIASHVSHPNVCAVHDFGQVDGTYFLAMEYLIGEPLLDVVNRGVERFDDIVEVLPYLAARIIADACEGMHAAHEARGPGGERLGIVHRDVSPQNLFITYEGAVKVVDFGCAKAIERISQTSTGIVKGKVSYAAPEQLRGEDVDPRADVWALGVCLWEAATLSQLFGKESPMQTAMTVLDGDIPLACDGRSWVPERLARIAERALQRDRDRRFRTARDLGRELRTFIADSGYTLESAELAEWMTFLFDERPQELQAQARRVEQQDLSRVSVLKIDPADSARGRSSAARPSSPHVAEVSESARPIPLANPRSSPTESDTTDLDGPIAPPTRKRRGWLVALAMLLVLGGGGYYLFLHYEPAPWLLALFGMETSASAVTESTGPDPTPPPPDESGEVSSATGPETDPVEPSDDEGQATDDSGENAENSGRTDPTSPRRSGSGGGGRSVTTVVSGSSPNAVTSRAPATGSPSGSESPTPVAATGGIRVVAHGGWAEVFAGGRRLGRTPVVGELPAGTHRLRILPYGNEPAIYQMIRVEPGVETALPIEIEAPAGAGL